MQRGTRHGRMVHAVTKRPASAYDRRRLRTKIVGVEG